MLKCIIVEDNFLSSIAIRRMIEELGYEVLEMLKNVKEVENCTVYKDADILISDVKLGNEKYAYDVLATIPNLPPVILVSSHVDIDLYAKCKVLNPHVYLVKPVDKITLKSAIEGALNSKASKTTTTKDLKVQDGKVFVKSKGKYIGIEPSHLMYIKSEGNYCYLFLEGSKVVIRSSLSGVLTVLNSTNIKQVQRAYAINVNHISDVNIAEDIINIGEVRIPIGRKYKKDLLSDLKWSL